MSTTSFTIELTHDWDIAFVGEKLGEYSQEGMECADPTVLVRCCYTIYRTETGKYITIIDTQRKYRSGVFLDHRVEKKVHETFFDLLSYYSNKLDPFIKQLFRNCGFSTVEHIE